MKCEETGEFVSALVDGEKIPPAAAEHSCSRERESARCQKPELSPKARHSFFVADLAACVELACAEGRLVQAAAADIAARPAG